MDNTAFIPNINIGQTYDQRYSDADIHYEALENLADFFGRNMPAHRHDRFFQLHYVKTGAVRVYLDEERYQLNGPMFFLTPPTVPHAFATEHGSCGHVLTVRQQLIWPLLAKDIGLSPTPLISSACVAIDALPEQYKQDARQLDHLFDQLHTEFYASRPAKILCLETLVRLIFILLLRLSNASLDAQRTRSEDMQIFQRFNILIEQRYQDHQPLPDYAKALGVTEARLNDVCRRMAGMSSKHLIYDRLMQEAKRFLLFTGRSVNEISYQLGFKDPAYFSRFFSRNAQTTPGQYRRQHTEGAPSVDTDTTKPPEKPSFN